MSRTRRWGELGFCLFLLTYIAVLAVSLIPVSPDAAFFPTIVLSVAGLLGLAKLASILSPRASRIIEPELHSTGKLPDQLTSYTPDEGQTQEAGGARLWVAWSWITLTAVAMLAFGFMPATALGVFSYVRWIAGGSLASAFVTAATTVVFMYVVFERAMRIDLGFGLLDQLF